MHRPDPPLPPIVTRAEARLRGMTDRQIGRRTARGEWGVARRGLLLPPQPPPALDPADLQIVAAVRSTGREVAVAVAHAARIWKLPEPLDGWGRPMLLALSGPTRSTPTLCIRVAPCEDGDLLVLSNGLLVTSPVRTVADCLRHLRPPDGLATADAAVRAGLVTSEELQARVRAMVGWPGVIRARRLVALVDGRRDSVLESWSAVAFDDTGVPQPVPQVDVHDDDGFVGRVDFRWDVGLVGESDGRAKYLLQAAQRQGADAERPAQVLAEEREREQRLRDTGALVVRWAARDVLVPTRATRLAARIHRELAAQSTRRLTGTWRPRPLMLTPSTGSRRLVTAKRYVPRA